MLVSCFKQLAIAKIIPTLQIAGSITWRTRKMTTEFFHNMAVFFWILANCFWMFSEFYGFSESVIFLNFTGKEIAILPFSIGISFLVFYYVKFWFLK